MGTFAERVVVPRRNLVPKPPELSFAEAACLPTAWLTAYRMLFTRARLQPGATVLVQGAGGGVATALIALGRAAGAARVGDVAARRRSARARWSSAPTRRSSRARGSPSASTWWPRRSAPRPGITPLKSLKPGGTIVISGATSGDAPPAGPDPDLLPAAVGGRLDHGHARRARPARAPVRRARRAAGDRSPSCRWTSARDAFEALAARRRVRQARAHSLNGDVAGDAIYPRLLAPPDRRESSTPWSACALFIMSTPGIAT